MKNLLLLAVICLIGLAGLSCKNGLNFFIGEKRGESRAVMIESTSSEYLKLFPYIATQTNSSLGNTTGLPLADDDLLSVKSSTISPYPASIFPYSSLDGIRIHVEFKAYTVYCNNRMVSINLIDTPQAFSYLRSCTDSEFYSLRSITISDIISDSLMTIIARIAAIKPDVGLIISGDNPRFDSILSMFKPIWMMTTDGNFTIQKLVDGAKRISNSQKLFLTDIKPGSIKRLPYMPEVQELSLGFSDSLFSMASLVGLEQYNTIHKLGIHARISDVSFLKQFNQLEQLSLFGCTVLSNIDALSACPNLHTLDLQGCDSLTDLKPISKLKHLRELALPMQVTQAQLEDIAKKHPQLTTLVMQNCKQVTDLKPVNKFKNLSTIFVNDTLRDYSPLYTMKKLKIVSVHGALFSDSLVTRMNDLKLNLPGIIIAPGICMGSGWLLAIFPLLALFQFINVRISRSSGKNRSPRASSIASRTINQTK